ncbi:MAG TPA: HNH endonuclease signature motif containing protein [Gemmatimonadaceae bacterium]|jgi:hypothetical protein
MSQEPSTSNPSTPEDWRVGLFFHSFYPPDHPVAEKRGKRGNQGYVIRAVPGGAYEVVLFSWLTGDQLGHEVKPLAYFDGASWYPTEEAWVREGARGRGDDVDASVQSWRALKEMDRRWDKEERQSAAADSPAPKAKYPQSPRRKQAQETTRKIRFDVFMRDGFKCRYCGRSPPAVELHVDHVVPISKGGSDDLSNLAASCVDCNFGKRDKLLHVVKPEEEPTP